MFVRKGDFYMENGISVGSEGEQSWLRDFRGGRGFAVGLQGIRGMQRGLLGVMDVWGWVQGDGWRWPWRLGMFWECFHPKPCTLHNPGMSSYSPLDREIQGSTRGGEVESAIPLQ